MSDSHIDDLARRLKSDLGELEQQERAVLDSIKAGTTLTRDPTAVSDRTATFGERLADRVAEVGGSWIFIVLFGLVLLGWMLLNTEVLSHWGMAFDPFPYIFLNLMLSTLAAIQAPVIMMSQNRQGAKDRIAAQLDYQVNLRAELELLRLHRTIESDVMAGIGTIAIKAGCDGSEPDLVQQGRSKATNAAGSETDRPYRSLW